MLPSEHYKVKLDTTPEYYKIWYDNLLLGNQYVNDFVSKEDIGKGFKAPIDIVYCKKCDLSQLKHTAPQELLYSRQYWYRSGVTETMKRELKDIVNKASD